jgi:hypothetical protein
MAGPSSSSKVQRPRFEPSKAVSSASLTPLWACMSLSSTDRQPWTGQACSPRCAWPMPLRMAKSGSALWLRISSLVPAPLDSDTGWRFGHWPGLPGWVKRPSVADEE